MVSRGLSGSVSGAPPGGGATKATAWVAGAASAAGNGLGGRRFGVAGGRPGLLSRGPDRDRGLRQPSLLALRRGLPRASSADGGAGA